MRRVVFTTILLLALCTCAFASDQPVILTPDTVSAPNYQSAPAASSGATMQVPLQEVAVKRDLTSDDYNDADAFVTRWKLKGQKATDVRKEFLGLRELDFWHHPTDKTKTPSDVYSDYQLYTQSINRVRKYSNIPIQPQLVLPPFKGAGSQGELKFEAIAVPECSPCGTAVSAVGAASFNHLGGVDEHTVAYFFEKEKRTKEEPPPGPNCPPGNPPPEPSVPSTVNGTPHDPSGPIFDPPATDPNQPGSQPNHGTGGNSWDPTPSHPRVADPVIRP